MTVLELPPGWDSRPPTEDDLAPPSYPILSAARSCDGAGDRGAPLRKAWQILRRQAPLRAGTPASRGWGPGYPRCQYGSWIVIERRGLKLTIHRRIAELVALLVDYTELVLGYDCKPGQCWGAACRPIRGSSTPSNHSWALAVDINSLTNPMQSTLKTDMPPAMVATWERYGFRWGGRYTGRKDTMHYEFMLTPADADAMTAKARAELGGAQEEDDMALFKDKDEFRAAVRDVLDEGPKKIDSKGWRGLIYKALYRAAGGSVEEDLNVVNAKLDRLMEHLDVPPPAPRPSGLAPDLERGVAQDPPA